MPSFDFLFPCKLRYSCFFLCLIILHCIPHILILCYQILGISLNPKQKVDLFVLAGSCPRSGQATSSVCAAVPKSVQFSSISSPLCMPPGGQSGSGDVDYPGVQFSMPVLHSLGSDARRCTLEVSRGVHTLLLGITLDLSALCNKLNIFLAPRSLR